MAIAKRIWETYIRKGAEKKVKEDLKSPPKPVVDQLQKKNF